jgi:hypothetical protein
VLLEEGNAALDRRRPRSGREDVRLPGVREVSTDFLAALRASTLACAQPIGQDRSAVPWWISTGTVIRPK